MENRNKYMAVAYELYTVDEEGTDLVEQTTDGRPFQFITGFGVAMPAFEEAVSGLSKGEAFEFDVPCAQAYGDYQDDRVLDLDKQMFCINGRFDHENIFKDAVVPLQNEDGNHFMGHVLDITDDKVVMDLNHPLAGCDLRFKGTVVESREATNEEIQSLVNHLSGGGCCGGCHKGGDEEGNGNCHKGGGCGHCHH